MRNVFFIAVLVLITGCKTQRYFVVRHAEKDVDLMTSDVPLSERGKQRAIALQDALQHKKIAHILSTDFMRTRATAEPLRQHLGLQLELYQNADSNFIEQLRNIKTGNVLIVGHSNTVDDIVNGLTGTALLHDLPDTQYGDLFIVKKRGRHPTFHTRHFGL